MNNPEQRLFRQRDTTPIINTEGTLHVRSRGQAINTSATPEQAAAETAKTNTKGKLVHWFDEETNEQGVVAAHTDEQSSHSTIDPTGRYAPIDLMQVVADNEMMKDLDDDELVRVMFIYNMPENVQQEFLRERLKLLRLTIQNAPEGNTTFVGANRMPYITNHHRLSRSIVLDHDHTPSVDESLIVPGWNPDNSKDKKDSERERKYLAHVMPRIMDELFNGQDAEYRKEVEVLLAEYGQTAHLGERMKAAFGYTIVFDKINMENAEDDVNIEFVNAMLNLNNRIYGEIEKRRRAQMKPSSRDKFKPELCKREYLRYDDQGRLNFIVSPEILWHGGVMEAMKVLLKRSPEAEEPMSDDEYNRVVENIRRGMKGEPLEGETIIFDNRVKVAARIAV